VGLKPSAMRGEARLRGLERAVADYLLKDHKPSARQGEARLRGLWQIIYSKTIISVIAWGASFPGVFNTDGGRWLLSDRHARRSPHWGAIVTALVRGGSTSMRTAINAQSPLFITRGAPFQGVFTLVQVEALS
jgi:hypothetical protein